MKLELNHVAVYIKKRENILSESEYDQVIDSGQDLAIIKPKGSFLVRHATVADIQLLLDLIENKKVKKLTKVVFSVDDKPSIKEFIKSNFKVVKAAGGVVRKGDQILMIHRLGKWDLPKGKIDKGEKKKVAAIREVYEECGVKAQLVDKICHTWHTYTMHKKRVLKKTYWYRMDCLNDKKLKPQIEEAITDVKWFKKDKALKLAEDSYSTINEVVKSYYNL